MQLSELINRLQEVAQEAGDEDPEVLLAIQPQWPFEHFIGEIVLPDAPRRVTREEFDAMSEDEQDRCEREADEGTVVYADEDEPEKPRCVFIGEAGQKGYLTGGVARELGWR